jgi:hypothetical protein
MWKAYAALSVVDKNILIKKAAKTNFHHTKAFHAKKTIVLKKRLDTLRQFPPNSYAQFTKLHFPGVKHLPPGKRFKEIARLWKLKKKK